MLAALTAVGPAGTDLYLPALPQMSAELGADPSAVQLTVAAFLVGLATAQIVAGPVGDRAGRRTPMLVGVVGFTVTSALCALAPSLPVLVGLRFAQGALGAAGLVLARAWVRDVVGGTAAARTYAMLAVVAGTVPVIAPLIGGQVLRFGTWRTTFWLLTVAAVVTVALVVVLLPETLPPERRLPWRRTSGDHGALRVLVHDPRFVAAAITAALISGALFAYLGGSSFVLEEVYGLDAQQYSWTFAANAVGIVTLSLTSRRLVARVGPVRLLLTGVAVAVSGATLLLVSALLHLPLPFVLLALLLSIAPVGLVSPNATAIALAEHADHAGTASGVLGTSQFSLAVVAAPLTGIGGAATALPLALVMFTLTATALVVAPTLLLRSRRARSTPCAT